MENWIETGTFKETHPRNVRKNYGNNGIYGRFSNTAEAFNFLAPLHSLTPILHFGRELRTSAGSLYEIARISSRKGIKRCVPLIYR